MNTLDLLTGHDASQPGPSAVNIHANYVRGRSYPDEEEDTDDDGSTAPSLSPPLWPIEHVNVFVPEDLHRRQSDGTGLTPKPSHLFLTGWAARGGPGEVFIVICDSVTPQQAADRGLEPLNHLRSTFGLIGRLEVTRSKVEQAGVDQGAHPRLNGVGKDGSQRDAKGKGREISSVEQPEGRAVWIHATLQHRSRNSRSPRAGSIMDISR